MQVDFHHAVTFVLARLAGFEKRDAEIIAYSSQYVDDAINGGIIRFKNHFMYKRIRSSHPLLSLNNMIPHASRVAWVPFHFLPGTRAKRLSAPFVVLIVRSLAKWSMPVLKINLRMALILFIA